VTALVYLSIAQDRLPDSFKKPTGFIGFIAASECTGGLFLHKKGWNYLRVFLIGRALKKSLQVNFSIKSAFFFPWKKKHRAQDKDWKYRLLHRAGTPIDDLSPLHHPSDFPQ